MTVSIFGIVLTLVGMIMLFRASLAAMLAFVLFASLLGGAEAFGLRFLGGASVQPVSLALIFLIARALLDLAGSGPQLKTALRLNAPFAFYCIYSALSAFILPRIFAGAIFVSPMRTVNLESLYDTFPLRMSSQNLTTAFYILGTLLASIVGAIVATRPRSGDIVVRGAVWVAWIHVGFGVLGVLLAKVGKAGLLDVFRNASYAQLDQNYQGIIRVSGIFPETADYTAYAFTWLVFMTELWIRDIMPKRAGFTALALIVILVCSTSASAYFAVVAYALILFLRFSVFPGSVSNRKVLMIGATGFGMATLGLGLAALSPKVAALVGDMVQHMTINKMDSISGRQRTFWALQGIKAFKVSHGLGIGAGSFRSSSLLTAIIGSTGFVGCVAFAAHCLAVLKPLRASTFMRPSTPAHALGAAASWTACVGLLPAFIASPTPDPGILFGLFGGLALGWRALPAADWAGRRAFAPTTSHVEPAYGDAGLLNPRRTASGVRGTPTGVPQ